MTDRFKIYARWPDFSEEQVASASTMGDALQLILAGYAEGAIYCWQIDTGPPAEIAEVTLQERANLAAITPQMPGAA